MAPQNDIAEAIDDKPVSTRSHSSHTSADDPSKPRSDSSRQSHGSRQSLGSKQSHGSNSTAKSSNSRNRVSSNKSKNKPGSYSSNTSATSSPTKPSSSSSMASRPSSSSSMNSKPTSSSSMNSKSTKGVENRGSPKPPERTNSDKGPKTPRTGRSGRRRRTITFKKTVAVTLIPGLDTYSSKETIRQWYQADEYGTMEDECDMTSEFLEHKKPLWPSFCARGLEAWTTEGELSKERHVQLAIDIVWQAQLEQWKESHNPQECWEFIRTRYSQVSTPCQKLAHKMGLQDEAEVQTYLAGVKSVEKNRRRMLGSSKSSSSASSAPEGVTSILRVREPPRRAHSEMATPSKSGTSSNRKASLSGTKTPKIRNMDASISGRSNRKFGYNPHDPDNESTDSHFYSRGSQHQSSQKPRAQRFGSGGSKYSPVQEHEASYHTHSTDTSSPPRPPTRKIVFQKRSKSKIPLSPVGSLVSAADSDITSSTRRLRSHMSVGSEDSTRRRMLRTASIKEL